MCAISSMFCAIQLRVCSFRRNQKRILDLNTDLALVSPVQKEFVGFEIRRIQIQFFLQWIRNYSDYAAVYESRKSSLLPLENMWKIALGTKYPFINHLSSKMADKHKYVKGTSELQSFYKHTCRRDRHSKMLYKKSDLI